MKTAAVVKTALQSSVVNSFCQSSHQLNINLAEVGICPKTLFKVYIFFTYTAQKLQIASENKDIKLLLSIITVYTEPSSQTELSVTEQLQRFKNVKPQKMINMV